MEKDLHRAVPRPKVASFYVFFKDPSNEAHRAVTALQMAFFSTQFIYPKNSVMKPFWKPLRWEGA